MDIYMAIALAINIGILYGVWRLIASNFRGKAKFYCKTCGTIDVPKRDTKGMFLIEIILWLCFIIPGVIYSLWRVSSRRNICPACGSAELISPDSPIALQARAK